MGLLRFALRLENLRVTNVARLRGVGPCHAGTDHLDIDRARLDAEFTDGPTIAVLVEAAHLDFAPQELSCEPARGCAMEWLPRLVGTVRRLRGVDAGQSDPLIVASDHHRVAIEHVDDARSVRRWSGGERRCASEEYDERRAELETCASAQRLPRFGAGTCRCGGAAKAWAARSMARRRSGP